MVRPDIRTCRERLETKRTGLLRNLEQLRADVSRNSGESITKVDAMREMMQESRMLWLVESALSGIDEGVYGKCHLCQQRLSSRRLTDLPWSSHCESCEKLAEARLL